MGTTTTIKEVKIGKFGMFRRFGKVIIFTVFRRKWTLPGMSEITVDQLNSQINSDKSPVIVDVRGRGEFYGIEGSGKKSGHIRDAKSIPIMRIAESLQDLSSFAEQEIVTICPGGGMSLAAAEIMVEAGFKDVKSLKGGMFAWDKKEYPTTKEYDPNYPLRVGDDISLDGVGDRFNSVNTYVDEVHHTIDARNESCPIPILKSKKAIVHLKIGQVLEILTTDPGSKADIPAWAHVTGQKIISAEERSSEEFRFIVEKLK